MRSDGQAAEAVNELQSNASLWRHRVETTMVCVMRVLCLAAICVLVRSVPLRARPGGITLEGGPASGGSLVCWGQGVGPADRTGSETEYAAIALGAYHGLTLDADGVVTAWGENGSGQWTVPGGTKFTARGTELRRHRGRLLSQSGSAFGWLDRRMGRQHEGPTQRSV